MDKYIIQLNKKGSNKAWYFGTKPVGVVKRDRKRNAKRGIKPKVTYKHQARWYLTKDVALIELKLIKALYKSAHLVLVSSEDLSRFIPKKSTKPDRRADNIERQAMIKGRDGRRFKKKVIKKAPIKSFKDLKHLVDDLEQGATVPEDDKYNSGTSIILRM